MIKITLILSLVFCLIANDSILACSAFGICKGKQIIVGKNLDWFCHTAFLVVNKRTVTIAPNYFTLRQVIEDRIKPLKIPTVYGLSFGHNKNIFPFQIGINTKLDADKMTIILMEQVVV